MFLVFRGVPASPKSDAGYDLEDFFGWWLVASVIRGGPASPKSDAGYEFEDFFGWWLVFSVICGAPVSAGRVRVSGAGRGL